MPNRSKIFITGHLGKDAVFRETQNGKQVTNFSVAVTKKFNDKENTTWWNVSIWGKSAEWAKSLCKGDVVHVEGEPEFRTYKKQDDSDGYSLDIACVFPHGDWHKVEFKKANSAGDTSAGVDSEGLPF